MPAPTPSVEDYIKGIFKLQSAGMKVTTSALAKQLGIGDGSVTDMVKKLSEKKFIQYTPYHGVRLTETGKRLALKTVRRHRLWEMFLVQFLGYSWDEIHDEAERLEHVTSDEMEHRLDETLGYPKVDPHGDPIPTAEGERGFNLSDVGEATGFDRIHAINRAKEVINQSEETRKRFEILAREVFKKLKACITIKGVNKFRDEYGAIDIIYKKLQDDRDRADISGIIKELHKIVDEAIVPSAVAEPPDRVYDISRIDFERLKEEFKKYPNKNTETFCLKEAVEKRLKAMIARNPLRADLYKRYQEIIADYNTEKDRVTIEETFAALLKFVEQLDNEERRAIREGLEEETLALFDLLEKPNLKPRERNKLKLVAKELLDLLKAEQLRVHDWREKEATRAAVKTFIRDFLWNEQTGLPTKSYSQPEVEKRAELVFNHVLRQYVDAWNHVYAA